MADAYRLPAMGLGSGMTESCTVHGSVHKWCMGAWLDDVVIMWWGWKKCGGIERNINNSFFS